MFICYLLNQRFRFLKTASLFVWGLTYISITFLIFNTILLPIMIAKTANIHLSEYSMYASWSVIAHIIVPITAFIFGFYFFLSERHFNFLSIKSSVIRGMIYPSCYLIYITVINFVPVECHPHGISIYDVATNINPANGGFI
jgi:hypothetical protein